MGSRGRHPPYPSQCFVRQRRLSLGVRQAEHDARTRGNPGQRLCSGGVCQRLRADLDEVHGVQAGAGCRSRQAQGWIWTKRAREFCGGFHQQARKARWCCRRADPPQGRLRAPGCDRRPSAALRAARLWEQQLLGVAVDERALATACFTNHKDGYLRRWWHHADSIARPAHGQQRRRPTDRCHTLARRPEVEPLQPAQDQGLCRAHGRHLRTSAATVPPRVAQGQHELWLGAEA
mmetsp:Transcript_53156/g.172885  ORF Transcript_53156/g.172885 Transcript_53156/m.172885 type:complete len:234 (+) Transcript_53156:872-1573(+)